MPSSRKATTRTWGSTDGRWLGIGGGLAGVAVLVAIAAAPAAEGPAEPDRVAAFMRAKLGHSQNVLEGLAVEDYARHSDEFRRSCNALRGAAKARNLDGAALAWMEVTMKCIQCHKYVRDAARGR